MKSSLSEAGDGRPALGWLLVAAQAVLLAVLAVEALRATAPMPIRRTGYLAMAAGALAIILASFRLGRALRAHPAPPADAVLRTDGLYRFVRHPIYAGLLLLAAGTAIAAGTARAAAIVCALGALLSFKARVEERLLLARFPDYATYAARTPRFLPLPRGTRHRATPPASVQQIGEFRH